MVERSDAGEVGKSFLVFGLVLACVGLAVAGYSLHHHLEVMRLGATDAACNINDTLSCDKVALSRFSEFGGFPLGAWGLGYFLAMFTLLAGSAVRKRSQRALLSAYTALSLSGIAVSLALFGVSYFAIKALCLSCMGIYLVCLLQAVACFVWRRDLRSLVSLSGLGGGGTVALLPLLLVLVGFKVLNASPEPQKPIELAKNGGEKNPATPMVLATKTEEIPIAKTAYSNLGEDYRIGADDAAVTLVEFSDFQCPACKNMDGAVNQLRKDYGNRVLIVFRNFPLDNSCNDALSGPMHLFSCRIAVLARCAGQYGKYWDYHELAFANQAHASNEAAVDWAHQIGLTDEQINKCVADKNILDKIKDDVKLAEKLGINSTPTLYINGRKVLHNSLDAIRSEIDGILNKS